MMFSRRPSGERRSSVGGFTLIELLVVVAIIMVLISIAMPNYLEATLRANVAASLAEMRSLGGALEMYSIDYKSYPLGRLHVLVDPVPYIDTLPRDKFSESSRYSYGARPVNVATRWLLAGRGPDRERNTSPIEFYPGYDPLLFIGLFVEPEAEGAEPFDYMVYSPTNGSISRGDLYFASDGTPSI